MNIFRYIYEQFFAEFPKSESVNKSGIVKSDYPKYGNGWIKGWVIDSPNKNLISVCKHSNPSTTDVNSKIYVVDKFGTKIERKIIKIFKDSIIDHDNGNDICICEVDSPFPDTITAYKFATKLRKEQLSVAFNQFGIATFCNLNLNPKTGEVIGSKRTLEFIPGDSGMPWFVWEDGMWKVATHTARGLYGIGPWYTSEIIWPKLKHLIDNF